MDKFQADLLEYPGKVLLEGPKQSHPYILLVIDCVSRYLFFSYIDSKSRNNTLKGFKDILPQIIKKREKCIFASTSTMSFLADYGEEFKGSNLRDFMATHNSQIFNFGPTGKHKRGSIIERTIRCFSYFCYFGFYTLYPVYITEL